VPQLPDQFNCAILYDYYIALADRQTWPPSHEVWKEYPTIAVLKRKDFPAPDTPTELNGVRIAADIVDLKWQPVFGEFYSEIEATDSGERKVTKVPPGYRRFRLDKVSGNVSARIRACNNKGCSSWSGPVIVASITDPNDSWRAAHESSRLSLVHTIRSLWRTIRCSLQTCSSDLI
jgi:hypothetical protein